MVGLAEDFLALPLAEFFKRPVDHLIAPRDVFREYLQAGVLDQIREELPLGI